MNDTTFTTASVSDATFSSPLVRRAVYAVGGSALVALCAHISIPLGFTPVPLTLQPFAVLLLGLLLDPVTAFAALAVYLMEGASGLPVFSPHGPGGTLQLFGLTGGYLMASPVAAAVTSALTRSRKRFWPMLISAAAGDIVLLLCGAAWLSLLTAASLRTSVLPFLLTDSMKVVAAAACATVFFSLRTRQAR